MFSVVVSAKLADKAVDEALFILATRHRQIKTIAVRRNFEFYFGLKNEVKSVHRVYEKKSKQRLLSNEHIK